MAKFKSGDKVKIQTPKYWNSSPPYRLADAEGTVDKWIDWDEIMSPFDDYVFVKIDKAEGDGSPYIGTSMYFHEENLKKL